MRYLNWRIVGLVVAGLAITLLVITLADGFIPYPTADNLGIRWDHYRYIAMSRHPFDAADPLAREAPYCWRILTPLLVHFSPLDWRLSFMLLTLIGMGGAAFTLYAYLRKLGYDERAGIFGLVLFFSLAGLMFNLRDFYLSDPLALLAIMFIFYQLQGSLKDWAAVAGLLIVLVLGVMTKETVLATLPLVLLKRDLGWRKKLLLCAAPVLVVLILRLGWPSSNAYSYFDEAQDVLSNKFFGDGATGLLMRLNFSLLGTWGPILVLLLYRPAQILRYLADHKAELAYLAIIYVQLIVAHNVDRLLVYGFPVVIPLLVNRARQLYADRRLNFYGLSAVVLALQLVYFYGRPPLWASLLVCGGLAVWLLYPPARDARKPIPE